MEGETHTLGRRESCQLFVSGVRSKRKTPLTFFRLLGRGKSTEEYFIERRIQEIEDGKKRELLAELPSLYTQNFPIKVLTNAPSRTFLRHTYSS